MAYTIEKKVFSDALSDTYKIVDDNNVHYNMTEYYTEGITNQTYIALSKNISLYRGLWTLKNMSLMHIPNIIHIEEVNGILVVWESFYGMPLKDYMEIFNKRISYKAILDVMSPLLDDCEAAHQNGLYFAISPETIYLTDGGILRLNTIVNPSASIYSANRGIAQSIFFMLTGFTYGNLQIPLDVYIPSPLRVLLNNVLSGRQEFNGIGEFHNALRFAVRASDIEYSHDTEQKAIHKKQSIISGVIAVISISCFLVLLLVIIFIINGLIYSANLEDNSGYTLDIAETPWDRLTEQEGMQFYSQSFELVYYNPFNKNEIFNGMVLQTENGLLYRRKSLNTAQLVKEENGEPIVLLNDVFPAFIQSDGDTVYFCDGYDNYNVYSFESGEPKLLIDKTAGFLNLYKDYLYFIDDEDNGSIYQLNIKTNEIAKINNEASYGLVVIGNTLYFINIYDNYAIYYIELDSVNPSGKPLRLPSRDRVYGYQLTNLKGNLLFCNESDWQLYILTPDNAISPFIYPISIYMLDIYDNILYYLDGDDYYPHELLVARGGKDTVLSSEECSYIAAVHDGAFFISDKANYALYRVKNGKREIVDFSEP